MSTARLIQQRTRLFHCPEFLESIAVGLGKRRLASF